MSIYYSTESLLEVVEGIVQTASLDVSQPARLALARDNRCVADVLYNYIHVNAILLNFTVMFSTLQIKSYFVPVTIVTSDFVQTEW